MKRNPLTIYRNMSATVRTSIWFTICNFLQRGTAFITVPIFTRLLTTDEYGLYNVYLSWFEIFVLFTSLKIPYEGLNNGLIRYEKDKDGYVSSMAGLITVLTICGGGVYLLFRRWIDPLTGLSSFVMGFMFLEILFNPPLFLWTNRERFDCRYRWPVVVTMVSTILTPAVAIFAVLNSSYKAEARIMATAIVQGILGCFLYFHLIRKGKKLFQANYWKFALSFNLPLIFYYLSQSLLNQSDRIMINFYAGTGKAGIYSVAYSAASILLLLVSAVNGSFNPWMYKKLKEKDYRSVGQAASEVCSMFLVLTVALIAFAPDLIHWLATEKYNEAIWIIPPVAASVFFVFLYMVFANVEMYYGHTNYIALISIFCSAANVILNAIFIPLCGYMAAGWTTLVCYILLAILHFILMQRACHLEQVEKPVFQTKRLLQLSVLVCVFSGVMLLVYSYALLRYAIIAGMLLLLFLQRDKLMQLFCKVQRKG